MKRNCVYNYISNNYNKNISDEIKDKDVLIFIKYDKGNSTQNYILKNNGHSCFSTHYVKFNNNGYEIGDIIKDNLLLSIIWEKTNVKQTYQNGHIGLICEV